MLRYALLLVLAVSDASAQGRRQDVGGLEEVWSRAISQLLKEPLGWSARSHHDTQALAFSPDGKLLAVTTSHPFAISGSREPDNVHVLIFDVRNPAVGFRQVDLAGICSADVSWNPASDTLLVCGSIIRLTDAAHCSSVKTVTPIVMGGHPVFWFDSGHVILASGAILNLDCSKTGNWPVEAGWGVRLTGASKSWIVLGQSQGQFIPFLCSIKILDRATHRVLAGWPRADWRCGDNMILSEGSEALCDNENPGVRVDKQELHCWSINGAREIPVPKQYRYFRPIQAAALSSRVIADRWGWDFFAFMQLPYPKLRATFDLLSGKQIASWKPRMQHTYTADVFDRPFHAALSAGGQYVAESGDGLVELYRLPN